MFQFIKRVLFSQRGTASASKSASYQNHEVLGRPFRSTEKRGEIIVVSDSYVVGTGTYTTGTTDTVSGVVKLFKQRAGWKCLEGIFSTNGLSASAGVGQTPVIGDGSDADFYMTATDFDLAAITRLAVTAHHFKATTDVDVTLTFGATGTPVAGQTIYYTFLFVA